MKFQAFSLTVLCAALLSITAGLTCEEDDGVYKYFEDDKQITPDIFPCMKVTTESPSTLQVRPPQEMAAPLKCSALEDGKESVKVKYERVEVNTGITCTIECKEQPGKYRCRQKPAAGECLCEPKKPQVVVKPISSELGAGALLGGQSEILEGDRTQTCHDKPVGFQFPDAVPCISIRADVTKRRVTFIKGKEGECSTRTSTEPETRYTESSPDNINLQGCVYVCKMAGPRCMEAPSQGQCKCASPGITKQLIPLDHLGVQARLVQTMCRENECGPCGDCIEGSCVLRKDAHLGNNCPCGEICPIVDTRQGNLGGQLLCEPNLSLECMAKPDWLGSPKGEYHPGTEFPDLCTEGRTDAGDTCGCAPGFEEKPGPNQSVLCVKSSA